MYHVTLSPLGFNARQVADGVYDTEYRAFFQIVKDSGAHFIFRTMHEANGSWYSWSGDPENFKLAWRHIWNLSREIGLTDQNVLFDFSVNSEDLPSSDGTIGGPMVFCTPEYKAKNHCKSFEDFYPGDGYVDIVGVTLYNWGRGRAENWATWKTFSELLNNEKMNTFARMKSYKKGIFIDEVGTTAVDFTGTWSREKVQDAYENQTDQKNQWILDMKQELTKHPEIIGALYFNRDRTQ